MNISRTCFNCGAEYKTTIYQVRLRGSNFCSIKCRGEHHSKEMLKTGGPNYKGGISRDDKYYRGQNWECQKRKALKRDEYQCQICHVRFSAKERWNIDVHHIRPYRLFGQDFETANDLGNLITLCKQHHGKVESGKIPCPVPKLI